MLGFITEEKDRGFTVTTDTHIGSNPTLPTTTTLRSSGFVAFYLYYETCREYDVNHDLTFHAASRCFHVLYKAPFLDAGYTGCYDTLSTMYSMNMRNTVATSAHLFSQVDRTVWCYCLFSLLLNSCERFAT